MSKKPEAVELTEEERAALMQRLTSNTLSENDRILLGKCLNFMLWLQAQLTHAKISLSKLRKLFNIIPGTGKKNNEKKSQPPTNELAGAAVEALTQQGSDSLKPRSRTGGRLSIDDYAADETISLHVQSSHAGDQCPSRCGGRLYIYGESAVIRIKGLSFSMLKGPSISG